MIVEIALIGGGIAWFGSEVARHVRALKRDEQILLDTVQKQIEAPKPQLGAATRLVIELLESDDDWSESRKRYDLYHFEHPTGVRVSYDSSLKRVIAMYIKDAENGEKSAEVTKEDRNALSKAIDTYRTRKADREQRKLTKALADRVLARANDPTLYPVSTGDDRRASDAEDDSLAGVDSVPAGEILFDHKTGQIVTLGRGGSKRVILSKSMKERYGFSSFEYHES